MLLYQDYTCLTTDEVLENAQREIQAHSVGFVYDDNPLGSGTLVQWDNDFGILTAGHVANEFDFGSRTLLRIPVLGCGHTLAIPCCLLTEVAKFYQYEGPDIALIKLPTSPFLSHLKAKKLFLNLTVRTERKLRESIGTTGLFLLSGGPAALSQNRAPDHGFSRLVDSPSMRFQGLFRKRFTKDGFDYVEVEAQCKKTVGVDSLGGVSGGGLWRVMVAQSKVAERHHYHGVALAGVAFFQRPMKLDGTRILLCHGGESIFTRLLAVVALQPTTN
jgi:hypothetical protein